MSCTGRRQALSIWKCRLGNRATYKALIEVFMKAGRLDYADFVRGILKDISGNGKLVQYQLATTSCMQHCRAGPSLRYFSHFHRRRNGGRGGNHHGILARC